MSQSTAIIAFPLLMVAGAVAAELDTWPPRAYLLRCVVERVPATLKVYHAETGRFGSDPWVCTDQNRVFLLAAAWSIEHPDNPYYHSAEVLAAVTGGGVALVEAQDETGRWRFDKKDGSYWGQIHMPWTYSRWVRAYLLVRDALPAEARATWERGLKLGFGQIARAYPDSVVHNIPLHRAMALYLAGVAFDNEDWRQRARAFMPKAVAAQDPAGFWSENSGPVVGYNYVYSDSLGIYYHFAQDPEVLEALRCTARFHAAILWPDGSSVACIDERNPYHEGIRIGNPGFSHTPEGRGYLLAQIRRHAGPTGRTIDGDMAAALLLYGGEGEVVMPDEVGEDGMATLGGDDALVRRGEPWSWAFSAYATAVPTSRWIQDRQNLLDVFHGELGLVAGGGNTKLQPYWSTFTVGDVSQLRLVPGVEDPNFTPDIDLVWTPSEATVRRDGEGARLDAVLSRGVRTRREPMLTEGFENVPAGGRPEGWRLFSKAGVGTMEATGQVAHDGKQSFRFVDADGKQSLGLRSPQLPATPGEEYAAEVWWQGAAKEDASLYFEFWDAKGERMKEGMRVLSCPGTGDWARYGTMGRAPAGAVGLTVLLYSSVAGTADGHFDDVAVFRLVPEVPDGGRVPCSVDVRQEGKELVLTYRAPKGVGAEAHLPLMLRGPRLELATGRKVPLAKELVVLSAEEVGDWFEHGGLRVSMPPGSFLRWPALHFSPYTKDGHSRLTQAKLVLTMPFDAADRYTVRFRGLEIKPFAGLAFEARDLPVEHSAGTYTKRLDNLGSQFLGGTKPGSWIRFALPEVKPGRYELIGDFVVAGSYGIVEVLLDDKVVGKPFDGYWAAVDASGTQQSFGEVSLGGGSHAVTVRIVGKNPAASNQIFSVKRWLLRPLD